MLFNSLEFIVFLPLVFGFYWFVFNGSLTVQNLLILCASYIFYGWWDWRFLSLILLSTTIDYIAGQKIYNNKKIATKRAWLIFSLISNLGLLGFFKYYNFFVESWIDAFKSLGYSIEPWTINIILPVGISFYTFQTMSYSLDIYKNKIRPTKDFISFAAFVSFFPQLVAGPIERASNLLPQLLKKRDFDYHLGVSGLRLILWGMFKKVVIADSLAPVVNDIFANYSEYSGGTLLLGAIYFGFQIYCDFSGYSDIAIGVSRLFGIRLMTNFNFPYFSRNIGEFWRRWHISLSSWFRDYLYIPLGGSRQGVWIGIRNVFVVFLVSGLWHGANWTFLAWGGVHALVFIPSFLLGTNRRYVESRKTDSYRVKLVDAINILITFLIVTLAWIFFRSESISHAMEYIAGIDLSFDTHRKVFIYYIIPFLAMDYLAFKKEYLVPWKMDFLRYTVYSILVIFILVHSARVGSEFIYFQF